MSPFATLDCCDGAATVIARAMLGDLQRLPRPEHATTAPNDAPEHHGEHRSRHTVDVLVRGRVATGNPAQPLVAAMGVRDERIVALGTVDELEGLRGIDTEIVDGGDGVVIPGLIEPHMHLWSTGLFQGWLDCSHEANPSFDDVVARIKDAVAQAKPDDWVCGQLFDPSLYPGEPVLTAAILDQLSSDTPIVIANASMHFAYVNSKVFEIAGITSRTPDPPSGKFYRADGQLTGVVGELNGMMAVISRIPPKTPEDLAAGLRAIMNEAASRGVTSMREALTGQLLGPAEVSMLRRMNAEARLPTRLSLAQSAMLGHQAWTDAGVTPGSGDEMVRTDAWKLMADGSNQGRSAFLRNPYLGQMGGTGTANFSVEELTERIREGHEAGWQVMASALIRTRPSARSRPTRPGRSMPTIVARWRSASSPTSPSSRKIHGPLTRRRGATSRCGRRDSAAASRGGREATRSVTRGELSVADHRCELGRGHCHRDVGLSDRVDRRFHRCSVRSPAGAGSAPQSRSADGRRILSSLERRRARGGAAAGRAVQVAGRASRRFATYVAADAPEAYVLYRELDFFEQLAALESIGAFDLELIKLLVGRTWSTGGSYGNLRSIRRTGQASTRSSRAWLESCDASWMLPLALATDNTIRPIAPTSSPTVAGSNPAGGVASRLAR